MIGKDKVQIIGIIVVVGVLAFWGGAQMTNLSFSPLSSESTTQKHAPNIISSQSIGYTDLSHNSIPTKMSLQGKVTDFNSVLIDDANLGVKISDANSCSTNVFYDYTFPDAIQDGFFNILLGQNELLKLNFNQDYFMCLYVNGEQLSGPQVFRGGQGEVHSDALYDGNVTVPLDANYLHLNNDLTVDGSINVGCGSIFWDDTNQTLSIQVSC
ncbi:MAG: hypothetical protein V1776_01755 [Candidatus Diapherotrites archaeon]